MGKPANRCGLCGGPQKRRSGRRADIVQFCGNEDCRRGVCAKHVTWDSAGDRWICLRCARDREQQRG